MASIDGSNRVAFVNVDISQGTQIVKMQVIMTFIHLIACSIIPYYYTYSH